VFTFSSQNSFFFRAVSEQKVNKRSSFPHHLVTRLEVIFAVVGFFTPFETVYSLLVGRWSAFWLMGSGYCFVKAGDVKKSVQFPTIPRFKF
jgi:hypothetical protein